eukprot:6185866-Pleurochrysis_carterae.AAC.1
MLDLILRNGCDLARFPGQVESLREKQQHNAQVLELLRAESNSVFKQLVAATVQQLVAATVQQL